MGTLGGPVTRDGAQEEARRELSRDIYGRETPNWLRRLFDRINDVIDWISEKLTDIFDWVIPGDSHAGGGNYTGLGIFAVLLAVVALAVVLRLWLGPVRRSARGRDAETDLASPLSAKALRAEAEEFARAGRYAEALRSRMRALVRMLEEKGVLDPRASRTAGELVEEMTAVTATGQAELRLAVAVFSDVWYGGRPAGTREYETVVRADEALANVRRRKDDDAPAEPTHAVPA
ncbi:DUF4129 domain-containing protein [Frankia sp. CNm7]|uniref:DUF4129 domain-containing protein n=1 Tax=Frankia nepalensis TaxID=1836974 RepID=A0A937RHW1_9ACTN|nr:DUF4129 domain-containing protein [Frankia nepalensis]MBL7496869.1 DUF4129 domain-containing protein [Frankia nepalensis]MBL7512069.1 DUF4129 domain-containing protein [Frankia nepalensis]MBL7522829.1 DUF4129 domain-containing protein [Frankia nepalensis]MBL7630472.1 DUF4129 domain-containing protein [Frankia nepalensis]